MVNFFYQPEQPLTERLRFFNDNLLHKDGSEQRIVLRYAPRQEFEFTVIVEDAETQVVNSILFGARNEKFLIPIWSDPVYLTSPAAAMDTTLTVSTMDFADFRDAGRALIHMNDGTFELLENITITDSNTITLDDSLVGDYPVLTEIYPVREAVMVQNPKRSRWPVNLTKFVITFQITENNVDLSDISTLPMLNSKPIFTDPNRIMETLEASFDQDVFICDGNTGVIETFSFWPTSRNSSNKGFKTFGAESLWRVRQFLHWTRGTQRSFYLPTFGKDLTPSQDLANMSSNLYVNNVGYTAFVNAKDSRNIIRVVLNDNTVYTRNITASAIISPTEERLTINTPWVADVAKENVKRIEIVEIVRMDAADIVIQHLNSNGEALIDVPVKTVLE